METPTLPAQLAESGRPRCPPRPHPEEVTGSPFDSGEIMWLSKLQADVMAGHRSLCSPCHYSWGGAGSLEPEWGDSLCDLEKKAGWPAWDPGWGGGEVSQWVALSPVHLCVDLSGWSSECVYALMGLCLFMGESADGCVLLLPR